MTDDLLPDDLKDDELDGDDPIAPSLDPEDDHESLEALAEEEDEDEVDMDEEEGDSF